MATKDELKDKAEAAGIPAAASMTKDELESALYGASAAGPLVGDSGEVTFEPSSKKVTGVQALEADDIPEAGL